MKRRINFTGRKTIAKSDVGVELARNDNDALEYSLSFDYQKLDLPGEADLAVEAYHGSSVDRYDAGQLKAIHFPIKRTLSEFFSETVYFRVKIIDHDSQYGKIIALASEIRTSISEYFSSLLPVTWGDLDGEVWKIDFDKPDPELVIHTGFQSEIPISEIVQRDPGFRALVFPAVLREILKRILIIEQLRNLDGEEWDSRWLRFAQGLQGIPSVNDLPSKIDDHLSEYEIWIDKAVSAFSRRIDVIESFDRSYGDRQ